ncbi:MAG: hypothetical protein HQ549_05890 [Candidatus Omnitrophica bacterium]|nr:hypothetical protein [Candidatus Omnitrophota bacterium]
MKTLKIVLSLTIVFTLFLGNAYAQPEKPILMGARSIVGTNVLGDEEDGLINLSWTREKVLQVFREQKNIVEGAENQVMSIRDIIKAIKAANKLMNNTFNPDRLDITDISLENGFLTVRYIIGLTTIDVHVDMDTYYYKPFFDKRSQPYADAALKTREDIARKMGMDIGEVHINGIERPLYTMFYDNNTEKDGTIIWPYPREMRYELTARVDHYTLTLDYSTSGYPWIGYDPYETDNATGEDYIIRPWPPYGWTTITLKSFVDNRTGRDLVKDAKNAILELFNPERHNIGVSYWKMENGVLKLTINLFQLKPYYPIAMRNIISVEVDLRTGEIKIDENIVDAVTKTREETAKKLGLDINDVHVNGIQPEMPIYILHVYPPQPILPRYYLVFASTDKFNLTYKYDIGNGTIELTSLVNRETGQDLLKNAIDHLKEILNPDSFKLDGWMLNGDRLMVSFLLPDGSRIKMGVDVNTGEPFMSESLKDAALKTREDIARKMGVDIGEVHINGIERPLYAMFYDNNIKTEYQVTARVGNYTLTLDYSEYSYPWYYEYKEAGSSLIDMPWPPYRWTTITLKSFIDNTTGRDLVKDAQDKVLDLFNPEGHNLGVSYWKMENGVLKLNINLFQYESKYPYVYRRIGSIIPVEVDLQTGEIKIDENIVDAVIKTREETAKRLGLDIGDVHINGIHPEISMYILDVYPPQPTPPRYYMVFASTEKFNLTYKYDIASGTIELASLVNRETGQNLLKNATDYLKKVLNPEAFKLADWNLGSDGILRFTFSLANGSPITISVNADTGEPFISEPLRDAILEARQQTSQNLNIDIQDVHVSTILGYQVCGMPNPDHGYYIGIKTPQFTLEFRYSVSSGTLELASFVNTETGENLLQNAIDYLKETINPDEYKLVKWSFWGGIKSGENGMIIGNSIMFGFELKDGSIVTIWVDKDTGQPRMSDQLRDAVLRTRNEIAKKMGVDIGEVRINGIDPYYLSIRYEDIQSAEDEGVEEGISIWPPYPGIHVRYKLTARVEHYTLVLDYDSYGSPYTIHDNEKDAAFDLWYPRNWAAITLRSFVDNRTGRDLVKEAQDGVRDLFNPEGGNIGVSYWSLQDGVLKLNIELCHSITPPWICTMRLEGYGGIVPVEVNLETGEVTINQSIVDAVTKAREKASEKLGIAYEDVHINGIMQQWVSAGENLPAYTFGGYTLFVTTPGFRLTFNYNVGTGNLELTSLANKETGAQLVRSAKGDMVERFGFEYNSIHINDFAVNDLNTEVKFRIEVDGQNATYIYKVDAQTGDIISIIIGIRIGEEDVFIDIADTTLSVEEIIQNIEALVEGYDPALVEQLLADLEAEREADDNLPDDENEGIEQPGADDDPDSEDNDDTAGDEDWAELIKQLIEALKAQQAAGDQPIEGNGGSAKRVDIEQKLAEMTTDSRFSRKGPTRANDVIPWLRRKTQIR